MRGIIVLTMFTASLAAAAWDDYEEQRELSLSASGIDTVEIEAGAGSLEVSGVSGADEIMVTATIQVSDHDADKARKIIESDLVLTLEQRGETAVLKAYFEHSFWRSGKNRSVQLSVQIPEHLNLGVDDGSGSMSVSDIKGAIRIEDGSGSITMTNVGGDVRIDDGSGTISADDVGGDLSIDELDYDSSPGDHELVVNTTGRLTVYGFGQFADGLLAVRAGDVTLDLVFGNVFVDLEVGDGVDHGHGSQG